MTRSVQLRLSRLTRGQNDSAIRHLMLEQPPVWLFVIEHTTVLDDNEISVKYWRAPGNVTAKRLPACVSEVNVRCSRSHQRPQRHCVALVSGDEEWKRFDLHPRADKKAKVYM